MTTAGNTVVIPLYNHVINRGPIRITGHVRQAGIPTDIDQILITRSVDNHAHGYCLTHRASGYLLLYGFPDAAVANEAALRLASLFPIEQWNALAKALGEFRRDRAMRMYRDLPVDDKLWMAEYGGPKVDAAQELSATR